MRPLATLLLLALTACGSSADPAPPADALAATSVGPSASAASPEPPSASAEPLDAAAEPAEALDPAAAPALLAQVDERAREAGSVRYSALVESSRDGQPRTVDARVDGQLDLVAGAGTADLDLVALADLARRAAEQGMPDAHADAPDLAALSRTRLSWTVDEVTASADGQRQTSPRDGSDTALLARLPEEPAGLLDVVATASGVTVVGSEQRDGVRTTHVQGTVDPPTAVDAGLGTSGQRAIAELPSLPVEVWLDGDGLPRRVRYTVALPSLAGGTRTSVTTYDYTGWGEPVDVTH